MKKIIILFALLFGVVSMPIYAEDVSTSTTISHHTGGKIAGEPININTASAAQLMTLKGIGERKAQAIINYRTAHGPFKNVNDLSQVKGIGVKMAARLESENPGKLNVTSE